MATKFFNNEDGNTLFAKLKDTDVQTMSHLL